MNVVDTSGWLAFFEGSKNAVKFSPPIRESEKLIVPTICIYEILKIILRESDENHLLQALVTFFKRCNQVTIHDLDVFFAMQQG